MLPLRKIALLTGLMTVLGAAAAQADVIINFTQTSASPPGSIAVSGQLVLTDAAYASGYTINYAVVNSTPTVVQAPGVLAAFTSLSTSGGLNFSFDTQDFLTGGDYPAGTNGGANLTAGPNGLPTGSLQLSSSIFNLSVTLSGSTFSGVFGSVADCTPPISARTIGACSFSGTVTATTVPVPEPASLALFGTGLVGLGALLRRRKAA